MRIGQDCVPSAQTAFVDSDGFSVYANNSERTPFTNPQRYACLPTLPNILPTLKSYLLDFDGLSSENSACHKDSHACFFTGDLAGDLTGDRGSRCRCSDLIDFEGDFERCRLLLGEPARQLDGAEFDSLRT